ncbi:MAG: hypothetical protein WBW48_06795, partial [Anaerolineae bacterium]
VQALARGCECGSKNLRVTGGTGFNMLSLGVEVQEARGKKQEKKKENSDYSGCHCERSEAIPKPQGGDCFVAKNAPRNDMG